MAGDGRRVCSRAGVRWENCSGERGGDGVTRSGTSREGPLSHIQHKGGIGGQPESSIGFIAALPSHSTTSLLPPTPTPFHAMSDTAGKPITCQAAVCWAAGEPLKLETVEVAPPKAHEVRIHILHTGRSTHVDHRDAKPR